MIEPGPDREAVFGRLAEEFLDRLAGGEDPPTEEYAAAHPDLAELIRDAFPLLRVIRTPAGPAESRPPRFGEFRIIRLVGRGGMGVVFEAVQESLGRRVALKVLLGPAAHTPAAVARFQREAKTAAALHHTNIVPVFAVGEQDGVPFYAMQFIDGRTLDRVIRSRAAPATGSSVPTPSTASPLKTPPVVRPDGTCEPPTADDQRGASDTAPSGERYRAVARLGLQAAEALAYAHAQGVLHRDIKPSNLLLDTRGNLWLTDFGLAKGAGGSDLTETGDVVGTLRYTAPERFEGAEDARSDIYSLGVTLYELLTDRPAFDEADRPRVLGRIRAGAATRPRRLDRNIPRDLETLVLKAMARAPGDRYATAGALADDLRRFLADRPIQARRVLWAEHALRWCRRNPALAGTGALAAVCLLAGVTLFQWERSRNAERRALAEAQARADLEAEHYFQTIALAERERTAGNAGRAERLLAGCPEHLRGWEWSYLRRARFGPTPPWRHEAHLYAMAVSPAGGRAATGGSDGSITVWDTDQGRPTRIPSAHAGQVRGLGFGPVGRRFASAGWDGCVRVWESDGSRCVWERRVGGYAFGVAISPDGRTVAASYSEPMRPGYRIARWDAETGVALPELPGHGTVVRRVRFAPDGLSLISADDDGWVKVWDLPTGTERASFRAHPFMVFDLDVSRDGTRLATAAGEFYMNGEAGEVKVWDTTRWEEVSSVRSRAGAIYAAALSPDQSRLATGGEDGVVRFWDTATGREAIALRGHREAVWGVAFSADGQVLYSAGGDHEARRWDARPVSDGAVPARHTLTGHDGRVTGLAFQPQTGLLASADLTGVVRVWDADRGQVVRVLPALPGQAHAVAFSPDGRRLAVAVWRRWTDEAATGVIAVFDTGTWEEVVRLRLDPIGVLGVAFSPDGRLMAAACDFSVVVVRADTGQPVWRSARRNLVTAVAFGPDGTVAAADAEGAVAVYAGATGECLRTLPLQGGRVAGLVFSPDGRRLASTGVDGAVRVWDTRTWRELPPPRGHPGGAFAVAFAPDGRRLISGGTDGVVRVWDAETGRELAALGGHTDTIHALAVGGPGGLVASAGRDRTVRLWQVPGLTGSPPAGD
jgi:WD40 repeat protein/serine/threonine protein kinase